jgi:hypothetical protein
MAQPCTVEEFIFGIVFDRAVWVSPLSWPADTAFNQSRYSGESLGGFERSETPFSLSLSDKGQNGKICSFIRKFCS